MVAFPTLGRVVLPAGPPTARAAGNSTVTSDRRGSPAARPGAGNGIDRSPLPAGPTPIVRPSAVAAVVATPVTAHNRLTFRDRHVVARAGRTTSSATPSRTGGTPNPEAAGPPRPAGEMVNRTLSWQIGTDATANLDNDAPHASTTAGRRRYPLGNQGSTPWQPVYGGTPRLFRPYGARGWVEGPAPRVVALPGGPYRPGTVLEAGAAGDGPQRVSGGAPHGLHSPTVAPVRATTGRYRAVRQQRPPRQNRPLNNRIAGQSYSQTAIHQDGRGGGRLPSLAPVRVAGVTNRFVRR